ncbi:hypothetical protein HNP38_000338 [Chryseobacterium defluvii]|uniref:Uncharacterized protein n=1 Tax=Chryseobacterium defluvii TaxID=160396 RepID=A0A840K772_9FLAO|nr:hypothetical protein [Chryseobacterium defluvii]MBB4805066.1 hypothetical protein [Chryseobacterium defluvii]
MDKETVRYIINYFSHLLTSDEKMAIKYSSSLYKLEYSPNINTKNLEKIYKKRGWLNSDQTVLELLKGGYENFELLVANRILSQDHDKIFFNTCPKCNKLARTHYARQCIYCTYNWHSIVVAQFKLNSCFQLTGRKFFILGEITEGEIKQGQYMDLTMLGLNKKPKIESIELAFKQQDGKAWEDIALVTNELTEEDMIYLKNIGSYRAIFNIVNEQ